MPWAQVVVRDESIDVQRLAGSANPLFFHGQSVDQCELTVGSHLVLGATTWEVPRLPFDATNKPDTWTGRGTAIEVTPRSLKYTDESGTVLYFVPDDGVPPPICS